MRPCKLLIAVGMTPQVITETVWVLVRKRNLFPVRIYVLTTTEGDKSMSACLHGEEGLVDNLGRALGNGTNVWRTFEEDVLGGRRIQPTTLVPKRLQGGHLDDIRNPQDDRQFANDCYKKVYQLTREEDDLVLVGSIAGGRKTMGAHMITAFSVLARPMDCLMHVLVSESAERDKEFYYPTEHKPYGIDWVDIPFPRLYTALQEAVDISASQEPPDLTTIEEALASYNAIETPPAKVVIDLGKKTLRFIDAAGKVVDERCTLRPAALATLLVFIEQTLKNKQVIVAKDFITDKAREQRAYIYDLIGRKTSLNPLKKSDISGAISDLKDDLKKVPYAREYFWLDKPKTPEQDKQQKATKKKAIKPPRGYSLTSAPLPVELTIPFPLSPPDSWPFQYLPQPEYQPPQ